MIAYKKINFDDDEDEKMNKIRKEGRLRASIIKICTFINLAVIIFWLINALFFSDSKLKIEIEELKSQVEIKDKIIRHITKRIN